MKLNLIIALAQYGFLGVDIFRAALDDLERTLAFDPLQEDLQRACLRLHYLAGDRAGAIRRYENLRQLLDEEMGVPPMAETRALYDAIITDTLSVSLSQPLTINPPPKLNVHPSLLQSLIQWLEVHRPAFKQIRPYWRAVGLVLAELFTFCRHTVVGCLPRNRPSTFWS